MGDVINFPAKADVEPLDDEVMCTITVNGKGEVELVLNAVIETAEQHNWLIAKVSEAVSRIVDRKQDNI